MLRLILACMLLAAPAVAKPISYVGGTMVMMENDETGNTLNIDYTFDPRFAAGLYAKKERGGEEYATIGPQLNALIYRWNLPDGQANIFNYTGGGASRIRGTTYATGWTGFLADYETRRIFTSYEAKFMAVDDIEVSTWQRARVGVAPYLANYDDLNTWAMFQVDYHPNKDRDITLTPLLRFFYKTTLAEIGVSTDKDVMFNLVQQF